MRIFKLVSLAVAALGIAASHAPASAAGTTRIETRPYYGAVITIEEGVRVFRPLPNTERVIVNPGGKTPLSLGFNETYSTERNYNYNYNYEESTDGDGGIVGGIYGGSSRHSGRGRHDGSGGAPAFRSHGGHKGGGKN